MPNLLRFVSALGALAALTATASAKIERTVEKSFEVQPGVRLIVSTSGGEVRVNPVPGATLKIIARERIRASSEADADEVLKDLELTMEQNGNEVVATASFHGGFGVHFGSWPPVQVDFIVTVPSSTSTELKTSGGDITVGDLNGEVHAHTSGGEIRLGRIGGDIVAWTSGGDIELAEGRGSSRLSTSGGNVSVGRIAGPANLRTSGGDIKVDAVEGTLDADTSGGSVRAGFVGPITGDCSLSTSGGEVKAIVGGNVGFHLDAHSSGGDVNAAGITITIDGGGIGKSSLSGDVNGGGARLKLRTSGGDIEVVSRRDPS
jgi:hypothetical protein